LIFVQDANNPKAERQMLSHHDEKMTSLMMDIEQTIHSQRKLLYDSQATLHCLRLRSEVCTNLAKVRSIVIF